MPLNEAERLADLESYALLDTPFEQVFDAIAALAASICNVPYAMISLVDRDRQWFKAAHGLSGVRESPRNTSFCAHTILGPDVLHVPDANLDDRFSSFPRIAGMPEIRLYAGAPITSTQGNNLGALCVISENPQPLTEEQLESLRQLSHLVTTLFEARKTEDRLAMLGGAMDRLHDEVVIADAKTLRCMYANQAAVNSFGGAHNQGAQIADRKLTDLLQIAGEPNVEQQLDELKEGRREKVVLEVKRSGSSGEGVHELQFQRLQMETDLIAAIGRDITEHKRLHQEQSRLKTELREEHTLLENSYAQLNRELEAARATQLHFMPAPQHLNGLRFDWLFEASSFVAGDIFDYFPLNDQFICFYVADVSGHGVSSALLSFSVQRQISSTREHMQIVMDRVEGDVGEAARKLTEEINQRLLHMNANDHYVTMVLGIFDNQTGNLGLVQAGHPAPVIVKEGLRMALTDENGVPLGMLANPEYVAQTIRIGSGDRLYLYSDGVTECRNPGGREFGEERMTELLTQPALSLRDTVRQLSSAMHSWRGEGNRLEDDMTFVAVEFCQND